MFSTLAGGRRYPGSIAHRHKNVTFGKVAVGVAKGTAMIVIGVPVCTIAAGLGATAIVAYGLASPFYYGGRKLVRKIRRHRLHRRDELLGAAGDNADATAAAAADRLTREDILIWLENCDDAEFYSAQQDDIPLTCTSHASESTSSSSEVAAAGAAAVRKKPALRRLFSRESRSFVLQKEQQLQQQQPQQQQLQKHRTKRLQYSELVSEEAESGDESDHSDLWKEMQSAVSRLREDRHSICPETVVAMDQPLLLTDGQDVLRFVRQLQLDGHLGQMMRANSMPTLSSVESSELTGMLDSGEPPAGSAGGKDDLPLQSTEDQVGCLQQQRASNRTKQQRRYKRTVSEGCGMAAQATLLKG